jgi:hypothetical protein
MSDESEKAARWETIERFQKAKQRLEELEGQCKRMGDFIAVFGNAIRDVPGEVRITPESISYPKYAGALAYQHEFNRRERVEIPTGEFNLEGIRALVDDYQTTLWEKTEARDQLLKFGVDLEPKV